MPTVTFTHEINCDEETFWKIFLDPEFNERLYKDGLKFPEWKQVSLEEKDGKVTRTTAGKPKLDDVPGPVAKIIGDSFRYTESGSLDRATKTWTWKLIPSMLADKVKQEGKLTLKPAGDGKVKRNVELFIEAKVFPISGMLESTTEKNMRNGWEKSSVFMNEWIAKQKG
jgi:hypothetical protein